MQRRDMMMLLGGMAAGWPVAADSQQPERTRRIGILMNLAEDDSEASTRTGAFRQALQELGWTDGRNVRIESRWGEGDVSRFRQYAAELVALAPDVIVANGTSTMDSLHQATRTVAVVFVNVVDPVGGGFVTSLARPGGNVTGFSQYEYGISTKLLELLKAIAPRTSLVAVIRDPAVSSGVGQLAAIQSAAPAFAVQLRPVDARDASEIERTIAEIASVSDSSLIVVSGTTALVHRESIVALATRYKLPAVYPARSFVASGGLISYGPDRIDPYRRAAGYVDRILKGEKPGDLPVQGPTKFELVINLKTAKALDLTVPPHLLARADEVIE